MTKIRKLEKARVIAQQDKFWTPLTEDRYVESPLLLAGVLLNWLLWGLQFGDFHHGGIVPILGVM